MEGETQGNEWKSKQESERARGNLIENLEIYLLSSGPQRDHEATCLE